MTRIARILGPVPPLDDAARARMERAVLDDLARPVRATAPRWRWPVAGVLAFAAVAALWLGLGTRDAGSPAEPNRHTGPAQVALRDAQITIESGGSVVATDDGITLERGAARFVVTHREGRTFRVLAGDVRIEDVGTTFRVAIAGSAVTVQVDEGIVDVTEGDATTRVGAGERWPAITAVAPPPPSSIPPPVSSPPQPVPAPPPPRAPGRKRAKESDPSAQYEQAAKLEVRDPARAIAIYRAIAKRADKWGSISLFAIARLELTRDPTAARKDLNAYLRRFPDGANAPDARRLLRGL